jgi:hypothetical protein
MGKNIADEGRKSADRHLPCKRVDGTIHLNEKANRDERSDASADQGDPGMLKAHGICEVAVSHNDETRKPSSHELFDRRPRQPSGIQQIDFTDTEFETGDNVSLRVLTSNMLPAP